MTEPILEIAGLSKSFGPIDALRDVDLIVDRGRITIFLGLNGAGKTTAIKCMLGFLIPDKGTISIRTQRIGYVPERPIAFPWLCGRDILRLTCEAKSYPIEEFNLALKSALVRFGFDDFLLSRHIQTYSSGNQKKFSYLQNMIIPPDILIVDEPFSALDPISVKTIRDIFLEYKKSHRAILLSTHLLAEAEKIADDVIIIKRGHICFRADLAMFRETHVLIRLPLDFPDLDIVAARAAHVKSGPEEILLLAERESLEFLKSNYLSDSIVSEPDLESLFLLFAG
jgi:ABC-2 type transport system ATP-binding protein